MEDFVAALTTTTNLSDDILSKLTNLLQEVDIKSLLNFTSDNFNSLFTLEHWAWKKLSQDYYPWINQLYYLEFFRNLALFNKNLIFSSNEMDSEKKAALLIPQTKEIINDIFQQIEKTSNDNDPYFLIISLWFDNLSYFIYEHTQCLISPIITDLEYTIACQFVMTDQYKIYSTQLQQSVLTHRQLFYIRTCSFSIGSYFFCRNQKFPFTSEEILRYFAKDYLELIQFHSFNVQLWSKELLSCIAQIINFICGCCWWGSDKEKCLKLLLPFKDISHEHIQALVRIIDYTPFHQQIQVQRSNDETILIDAILNFLLILLDANDLVCFIRSETKLLEILLPLAETSGYNRISLCAYGLLGKLLSDEHLKELKITNNLCGYFFYMLEQAWNNPAHKFQRTSVPELLRGFLNLAKNDAIQQKTADTNKVLVLIEMCDQYPVVFDILWALSFNHDIQEQLRSNRKLMLELTHLKQELNNEQMRKITHGILWNLESIHEDRAISEKDDKTMFDVMISYSHKDKLLCKQIYDELIKSGYHVWIDFDQMHGNVMDAMAQAIERANIIVICMSDQYRRSNYCRAEAHYAFQRQLKIVPVLLEKHYKPDGWLLFLIGQLLYVDFTKNEFFRAMEMLFKELEAPFSQENNIECMESAADPNIIIANLPIPLPVSVSPMTSDNILKWTESEVQDWLIRSNLVQMSRLLSDYNGSSLIYLNKYLANGDSEQILKLLEEDSLRRTNQVLSLVELARFQSLVNEQQQQLIKKRTKKNSRRHKWNCSNFCQII